MELHRIKQLAFERMGNKHSPDSGERGEKYHHGQRVAALVLKLREYLYPNDASHDEVLTVAAWFHDICNGEPDHCMKGAREAERALSPYCTKAALEQIVEIIAVHDDRNADAGYGRLIRLHQDADHLDHFGVMDVWRCFIYALPHDQTMGDVLGYMANTRPAQNAQYRQQLHFEISRKIFDEKMGFLKAFTERFQVEGLGGIWDERGLFFR